VFIIQQNQLSPSVSIDNPYDINSLIANTIFLLDVDCWSVLALNLSCAIEQSSHAFFTFTPPDEM
jgi:hypothetical protein